MNNAQEYLGSLKAGEHISIIGGGISGLMTGYFLKKENIPFTIYEKEKRLGGKIQTTENEHGIFEHAANAIFSSDLIFEVLTDLALVPIESFPKLRKIVWRNQTATSPPLSIIELLSLIPKLFNKTPDQKNIELTVEDFFKPFLGEKLTNEVLAPALTGIYAEDVSKLHFHSIFKAPLKSNDSYLRFFLRLKRAKKKAKLRPSSLTFSKGLEELINALREDLTNHIKLEHDYESLPETNTIIATDAADAAKLLSERHPEITTELERIEYSCLSLNHSFSKYQVNYLNKAFGMVFRPSVLNRNIIGVLANDQIFPLKTKSTDLHSYSFIIQGDKNIEANLERDLVEINAIKIKEQEVSSKTISWKRAIPIYNYQRYKSISKIRNILSAQDPGIVIHGNYINGISLRDIFQNSKTLVNNLTKITS